MSRKNKVNRGVVRLSPAELRALKGALGGQHALDTRSDTAGSLAAWAGNQLHDGRFYSHPTGVSGNRHRD